MSDTKEKEDLIRAAVNVVMEPIIRLLEVDGHTFSTRPCQTCRAISSILGKPFGCSKKALTQKRR